MRSTIITSFTLICVCGLLTTCSSSEVLYDYYTQARFSTHSTFSWLENTGEGPGLIAPVDEYLRNTVSETLKRKGLRLVEDGGDLLITYHIGEKAPLYPSRHGYTYWPARWSYGGYYDGIERFVYKKGTLILDLIDRRSNQLLWRGSAPGVISNAKMERLNEDINEAVGRLLVNFPPPEG